MKIYNYDQNTKELVGDSVARKNPAFGEDLQPEYLIPAFSTSEVPPSVAVQQAAVFSNGAWSVVVDLRGVSAWDAQGNPVVVRTLGSTLEDLGYTDIPPDPVASIPESVSPRQIRQALTRAGLRSSVEAAVAAGDADTIDWWDYATSFERNHVKVIAMGEALNVSSQALDDLWVLAGSL